MKYKELLTILILLLLTGLFYWFQWRPTEDRKVCWKYASDLANTAISKGASFTFDQYQSLRKRCLDEKGYE
ncbi:hypothetical protein A2634_03110 [Candidatus Amesbacteria bacterium RIFCSPHIGHO2_01_FULL_48_32]|uniref:Uncharacterized protein n=1 Tax=Candidatus Amesbacteria bacterium RIFCSPLOWO2_01_FULL_48_25 TaxID=1797259 RepID=A0A1F4ZBG3_9BACT|nr:MAG: hypothetical protein A2634_03110 [Candidatus Amesbacteria bacterium RIFCSPHIGHO2_01_FULL_48_32]OGD03602.1 MAG: hypothetical protein A2989_02880 [Candidatus Amesbacteria bacterium RIFCSPLOWO2_01_FULL_48_25]